MTSLSHSGRCSVTASATKYCRTSVWLPTFLILLASIFRVGGLARDSRFHGDEALFASFARRMVIQGDWYLDEVAVDKPPTTFLLVGGSLSIWGETEFAARLPNVFANLIALAAFYGLAKYVTGRQAVANLALLLLALNPLDIAYAPTVFQDPPMLACMLVGAGLAARRRWGAAGLALGLMVIMKPTGLWVVPLCITIGLMIHYSNRISLHVRQLIAFAIGLAVPVGLVLAWDANRSAQSFIELGRYNNDPHRLIHANEAVPRAEAWLSLLGQYAAYQWLALVLALVAIAWLLVSREKGSLLGWLIAAFLVCYMGVHWFLAFNIWDRYVLLIAPFALLIVAQGMVWLLSQRQLIVAGVLLVIISWGTARDAVNRTNPDEVAGIDEMAATLNTDYAGRIVYDYWLGWHFRWYLGADPQLQLIFFPTPEDLAIHLQEAGELRYFAALSPEVASPWIDFLATYDVKARLVYQPPNSDLVLYRLIPPNLHLVAPGILPLLEVTR